jgi:hypothetical protein
MNASSTVWIVADWMLATVADPELLVILVAGLCALAGFWARARIAEQASRSAARPGDDVL